MKIMSPIFAAFAIAALFASDADATPQELIVRGQVQIEQVTGLGCTSPVGLCANSYYTGDLVGTSQNTGTLVLPSQSPGVVFVNEVEVFHSADGDLFMTVSAALSATPATDGAFASLHVISGGTGRFAGATGYLQLTGTSMIPSGAEGRYHGKIILP